MSEPPHGADVATGSRQEVAAVVAATVAATAMSAVPPTPVPTVVDQAAMVEIPDDDVPPPGWASGRTGLRQPLIPRRGYW
jgi:hypothetical protein